MNSEQWKSTLTTIIPVLGTLLITFGLASKDTVDYIVKNLEGVLGAISTIVGAVSFVGAFAYKLWANRKAGIVTAAANLDEVKSIKVTTPELAGSATPANVTR